MDVPKLSRFQQKPDTHLHSEIHVLVDDVRREFGETAKKGKGSFGFYIGCFSRIGIDRVRTFLAQSRDANDPKKMFWFLVGKDAKERS